MQAWEMQHHKRHYDQKGRCVKLKPGDLIMACRKGFQGKHKIADHWEHDMYEIVEKFNNTPVYKVFEVLGP